MNRDEQIFEAAKFLNSPLGRGLEQSEHNIDAVASQIEKLGLPLTSEGFRTAYLSALSEGSIEPMAPIKQMTLQDGAVCFDYQINLDGSSVASRAEYPDGSIRFNIHYSSKGIRTTKRIEFPNREIHFDIVEFPDGSAKIQTINCGDGELWRDITIRPDGSWFAAVLEMPDGTIRRNVTRDSDSMKDFG